jgi:class 3 adenylate cyclase
MSFAAIPEWVRVLASIIGVLTTVVGVTVYITRLKVEGTRQARESEAEIKKQRTTIAALESSVAALSHSVALLREGKDQVAGLLTEIEQLMTEGRQALLAQGDSILVRDPYAHDFMVFLIIHGEAAEQIKRLKIPVHDSVAGKVLRSGVAAVYPDAGLVPNQRYETTDVKSGFRSETMLTMPLKHGGQVIGVLQYVNRINGHFTSADVDKVRPLCDDIAARVQRVTKDPTALKLLGITETAEVAEGSFLFLDLTSSSSLFQTMPTSEAVALLNEYYDRMVALALRHDGMLDRLLGDGMLIRFNVPKRVTDFPAEAVRCALAMQDEFRELRNEWRRINRPVEQLGHRIGIATGTVTAGMMGHSPFLSYTVLGTPVNRAARLCQVARETGSGIAICETTYERVRAQLGGTARFGEIGGDVAAHEVISLPEMAERVHA